VDEKWCLLLISLLAGRSAGKLNRSTAEKEIQSHFKGNQSTIVIQVGRVSSHCVHVSQRDGTEKVEDLNPQTALGTIVATKAGYVTVTPDGENFWKVDLTDKGRQVHDPSWQVTGAYHNQLKGCDYKLSSFIVAHPELAKITNLSGDETAPTVNFEWTWVATEFGATLRENGPVYSQLVPEQKKALSSVIQLDPETAVFKVLVPVPPEGQMQQETVQFQKSGGSWHSK
jgi:hypothetical protein